MAGVSVENGGPARLLQNAGGTGNHWLRLVLEGDGKTCNKSAIGARVVVTAGELVQKAEVRASRGYLSCSELTLTFGLGSATRVDRVEVHWPGRGVPAQALAGPEIDRVHHIRKGGWPGARVRTLNPTISPDFSNFFIDVGGGLLTLHLMGRARRRRTMKGTVPDRGASHRMSASSFALAIPAN